MAIAWDEGADLDFCLVDLELEIKSGSPSACHLPENHPRCAVLMLLFHQFPGAGVCVFQPDSTAFTCDERDAG